MQIAPVPANQPEVLVIIEQQDAYQKPLCSCTSQLLARFADYSRGVVAEAQLQHITASTPHKNFHAARLPAAWLQRGLICAVAVHKPAEFLGRSI